MSKRIFQGLLAGVVGAGLFFSFFMTISVAALALIGRLTVATVDTHSIVVSPVVFFRTYGLPLSAVAFAICFYLGMRRLRPTSGIQPGR